MSLGHLTDIAILLFLFLQTFLGWRRGLLWQVAGVASLCFGMLLAWLLGPLLSPWLIEHVTSDPLRAKLVAFLLVVGGVGLTVRVLAAWAEAQTEQGLARKEREERRGQDRILGGIFGALKGCIVAALIIAGLVSSAPASQFWRHSRLAQPLATVGSRLLPEGAVREVRLWAARSAADWQQGLDIQ